MVGRWISLGWPFFQGQTVSFKEGIWLACISFRWFCSGFDPMVNHHHLFTTIWGIFLCFFQPPNKQIYIGFLLLKLGSASTRNFGNQRCHPGANMTCPRRCLEVDGCYLQKIIWIKTEREQTGYCLDIGICLRWSFTFYYFKCQLKGVYQNIMCFVTFSKHLHQIWGSVDTLNMDSTRLAPTSYKWTYNPYKWPYK